MNQNQLRISCALDVILPMLISEAMLLNYVVVHTYDRLCLRMQHSVKLFEIQSCHARIVMGCEVLGVDDSRKEIVYNPLKVFNPVR